MNSLELFSGTGIVSRACLNKGFDAWSVDFNAKFDPRVCCNILDFNYKNFPDSFDFIWASPDCTFFSRLNHAQDWDKKTLKYRKYDYNPITPGSLNSINLVNKTFEIINHYKPKLWVIENPVGRFRHLNITRFFVPFIYSVNYKDWGFDYSKETDLFTNCMFPFSTIVPLRVGKSVVSLNSKKARSVVPLTLINFILNYYF